MNTKRKESPIDFVATCSKEQSVGLFNYLENLGFPVEMYEGNLALRENEAHLVREILQIIFMNRLEGWWNFRSALIRKRICTEAQFKEARKSE